MNTKTTVQIPEHQVAIVTIPKVAGSSIKAAVLEMRGVGIGGEDVPHGHRALSLAKATDVPADYIVFAFLRNPWDRLVSCYVQKICTWRCARQGFAALGCKEGMPFRNFIRVVRHFPKGNEHWRPQTDFIGNRRAIRLFDFRALSGGWSLIQKIIPTLPALKHFNKSDRGGYRKYYSDETKEIVRGLYAQEIELMGFSF